MANCSQSLVAILWCPLAPPPWRLSFIVLCDFPFFLSFEYTSKTRFSRAYLCAALAIHLTATGNHCCSQGTAYYSVSLAHTGAWWPMWLLRVDAATPQSQVVTVWEEEGRNDFLLFSVHSLLFVVSLPGACTWYAA